MARAGSKTKVPPMKNPKSEAKTEMRLASVQILVKVDLLKSGKKVGEGLFGPQDENGQRAYEFYNTEDVIEWAKTLEKQMENISEGKVEE